VRILVTGSGGFVGRWFMRHLAERGDEGIGTDEELDVTDAAGVAESITKIAPDAVCHLAAQSSVGASWTGAQETYRVNVMGVVNVLDAALLCADRPRVLLISSSEVYGRVSPGDLPVAEQHPMAPVSPYAASKAAAEMAGLQAWLGSGLEVVRARPFNHTGPGQRPDFVVPALARQVANASWSGERLLRTGNLGSRRDISDVRDVVIAYRLLLDHGTPGEVYNVCGGRSVTIREVAETLISLAGGGIEIHVDPERVRPVDIPELRGDPSRLQAATDWRPTIPLATTLADVLSYWQQSPGSFPGSPP
jgi:GDP-4-dehydro-6-deoxy-D-mannose reductase